MAKLSEGRLQFDFEGALAVEKLDRPGVPLPHGMAFVDFVVEEKGRTLLIEVKDPEGAPASHKRKALREFIAKMERSELIHQEIVPKARDSYSFLHLMERDARRFILVCVLGVGGGDTALLGNFKNRLLQRVRQEAAHPWVRHYIEDCIVVTPASWAEVFPGYPLTIS